MTGTLKTFTKPGDTGRPMHRRFRPECGSGVVDEADALPSLMMVNAGTLDDRGWARPSRRSTATAPSPECGSARR